MRLSFRSMAAAAAGLAVCLLSGCGGTVVKGKVTDNGKPLTVPKDKGLLIVAFIRQDAADPPYPAETNPDDGTFTVPGPSKSGIPSGKYKVAIQQFDPYPATDKLDGKFTSDKTPIVRDVPGGNYDIDISKP